MATKRKYVKVTVKKYKALQEFEKGKVTKNLADKFHLSGNRIKHGIK